MRRLVVVTLALSLLVALAPVGAGAQEIRLDSGTRPAGPGAGRPPSNRPRPPFIHRPAPFFPCCLSLAYRPAEPPPPVTPELPPIGYVVPGPPPLVYVPAPRVEPAPEIHLPMGRWERHGNGREYPYTWVWVRAPGTR